MRADAVVVELVCVELDHDVGEPKPQAGTRQPAEVSDTKKETFY